MGHLREKYVRAYFLKEDDQGRPTLFGAEGSELYKNENGRPRDWDKELLDRVHWSGRRVIEFGFGRGEAAQYMMQRGVQRYIGVDFSRDAYELALALHRRNNIGTELYCEDALEFVRALPQRVDAAERFDVAVMFDFVEHVPRAELTTLFAELIPWLSDRALLVVNTPIFGADNDVLTEGLKREARDSSDLYPETSGMHCNRYTLGSLKQYMHARGFVSIQDSGHFFVRTGPGVPSRPTWRGLAAAGFPVADGEYIDKYEISGLPPGFADAPESPKAAQWRTITAGPLAGRQIHIDDSAQWQKEIIAGTHDAPLLSLLRGLPVGGGTILDLGGYIGYHAMLFADAVGPAGRVLSFEPNAKNRDRLRDNLARNPDLASRVRVEEFPLADREGPITFHFSEDVESGVSSGSFVDGVETPYDPSVYERLGFRSVTTQARTLDSLVAELSDGPPPVLVKIDVEGSEASVLEGSGRFIERFHPDFFIELHGITCTLPVLHFLHARDYHVRVVEDDAENRLFIHASHRSELFQGSDARAAHLATEQELVRRAVLAVKDRDLEIRNLRAQYKELDQLGVEMNRIRVYAEGVVAGQLNAFASLRLGYDAARDGAAPVTASPTPSDAARIERVLLECSRALADVQTRVVRARGRTPLGLLKRAVRRLRRGFAGG